MCDMHGDPSHPRLEPCQHTSWDHQVWSTGKRQRSCSSKSRQCLMASFHFRPLQPASVGTRTLQLHFKSIN
jgi:hypothetical protein